MKIRNYSKKELALLYFPDSLPHTASNHLMRWINRNRELCQALEARGYYRTSKHFTSIQVSIIFNYIGEPWE